MLQAIKYGRLMKNMHEKIDLEHERKSLNSQIQAMMKEKVQHSVLLIFKRLRYKHERVSHEKLSTNILC